MSHAPGQSSMPPDRQSLSARASASRVSHRSSGSLPRSPTSRDTSPIRPNEEQITSSRAGSVSSAGTQTGGLPHGTRNSSVSTLQTNTPAQISGTLARSVSGSTSAIPAATATAAISISYTGRQPPPPRVMRRRIGQVEELIRPYRKEYRKALRKCRHAAKTAGKCCLDVTAYGLAFTGLIATCWCCCGQCHCCRENPPATR